nr:uncharacterized protein CI109_005257 [Kwoniella shandongensis]KAA5526487.1 hypothetical protein CI109_005257 [Kwoniella shandongensis]
MPSLSTKPSRAGGNEASHISGSHLPLVNPAVRQLSPNRITRPASPLLAPIPLNYTLDPKAPLHLRHLHTTTNRTPSPTPSLSPETRTISRELTTTPSSSSHGGQGRYVRIVEVSPRDGLQNVAPPAVPTKLKKELVERLLDAGVRNVEVGSFVRGDWVPQMADTPQLLPLLPPLTNHHLPLPTPLSSSTTTRSSSPFSGRPTTPSITPYTEFSVPQEAGDVHYPVLVPNMRGLENLLKLEEEWEGKGKGRLTDEIAVFVSATEAFSMANNHAPIHKVLAALPSVIHKAHTHSLRTRGYVSCVITCPYSGPTDPDAVVDVVERLLNMGCYEVSLGDTTGEGDPESWRVLWERAKTRGVNMDKIAAHCHDTFSMALSSILSLLPHGLRTIDSSLAGLGGCPYSPGATGNVPTEDVVYALHKLGYETGIDLDRLVESGNWLSGELGVRNESRVGRAIGARKASREKSRFDKGGQGVETEAGM